MVKVKNILQIKGNFLYSIAPIKGVTLCLFFKQKTWKMKLSV